MVSLDSKSFECTTCVTTPEEAVEVELELGEEELGEVEDGRGMPSVPLIPIPNPNPNPDFPPPSFAFPSTLLVALAAAVVAVAERPNLPENSFLRGGALLTLTLPLTLPLPLSSLTPTVVLSDVK